MSTIKEEKVEHFWEEIFEAKMSVCLVGEQKFLLGVQIAALLKRETFNLYRSMKIKDINIQRASPEQVEYLTKAGAVRAGTHSITLVQYEDAISFISESISKKGTEIDKTLSAQPRKKYSPGKKGTTPPKSTSPRSTSPRNSVLITSSENTSPENNSTSNITHSPTRSQQNGDQDKKGKRKAKRPKLDESTENDKNIVKKHQPLEESEIDGGIEELPHKNNNFDQHTKDEEMREQNGNAYCDQQSDDWETYSSTIEPIYPTYSNGSVQHPAVASLINPLAILVPNPTEYRNLQNTPEYSWYSNDYYSFAPISNSQQLAALEFNNYHRDEEMSTPASRPYTFSGYIQNTYQNNSIPTSFISNSFLTEDNFLDFFADQANTIKLD